jgi:tRNA/rRNA methyltransferase
MDITVVLVEIANPGNLGAIARVMANFNVSNLVLVNPKCSPEDIDALVRSKQAYPLLKKATVVKSLDEVDADYLIATTSRIGRDYNIPRSPISPEQLAKKISKTRAKFAVVFGRESDGLNNKEILNCDFSVSIPTHPKYSAMNISHAVSIILYEIFRQSKEKTISDHIIFAAKQDKDVLLKFINLLLDKMEFATKEKRQTQKIVWKRMVGKATLTKRELFALIGFFKKL